MVKRRGLTGAGPGLFAPALVLSAVLAAPLGIFTPPVQAQQSAPAMPDASALNALLWSTMAAVDHANKTGNYSVLRDLGTRGFQANNNAATLAAAFVQLRQQRVDLSDTLLVAPTHEFAPAMIQPGVIRMRGRFNLRPTAIGYDLIYQWDQGWRLHAVSIMSFAMPTTETVRR